MINPSLDPKQLHEAYAQGQPFPHIVVDGFLTDRFAQKIADELEQADVDGWNRDDHAEQVNKRWMDNPDRLPVMTGTALRYLNTPDACSFFSQLTGIDDLQPDTAYLGGGVHVSLTGGRLGVHSDFNLHPANGMHRRVNALIFLNRDWNPEWHGQLELWSKDLSKATVEINPDFNRLVAFTITDDAFHGVPKPLACPPDRRRLSLALYYYTRDRPEEEKAPFHWAAWQRTGQA